MMIRSRSNDWLPIEVTVAPTGEPLSTSDATAQIRADPSNAADQAHIATLTKAARGLVESRTGLKLMTQTVKMRRGDFPSEFFLPIAPVQSISTIQYLDTTGTTQTLSPSVYLASLYGLAPKINLVSGQSAPTLFDSPAAVTITAVVGFVTVPDDILHALKVLCSHWYDNRGVTMPGNASELPVAVDALLANWKLNQA